MPDSVCAHRSTAPGGKRKVGLRLDEIFGLARKGTASMPSDSRLIERLKERGLSSVFLLELFDLRPNTAGSVAPGVEVA